MSTCLEKPGSEPAPQEQHRRAWRGACLRGDLQSRGGEGSSSVGRVFLLRCFLLDLVIEEHPPPPTKFISVLPRHRVPGLLRVGCYWGFAQAQTKAHLAVQEALLSPPGQALSPLRPWGLWKNEIKRQASTAAQHSLPPTSPLLCRSAGIFHGIWSLA